MVDAIASLLPSHDFVPVVLVWIASALMAVLILDWCRTDPAPAGSCRLPPAPAGVAGHLVGAAAAGVAVGFALGGVFQ